MAAGVADRVVPLADGGTLRIWEWVPDVGRLVERYDAAGDLVTRAALNLTGTATADEREADRLDATPDLMEELVEAVRDLADALRTLAKA